jgi:sRNA-binding carbon storage regulator CsrA
MDVTPDSKSNLIVTRKGQTAIIRKKGEALSFERNQKSLIIISATPECMASFLDARHPRKNSTSIHLEVRRVQGEQLRIGCNAESWVSIDRGEIFNEIPQFEDDESTKLLFPGAELTHEVTVKLQRSLMQRWFDENTSFQEEREAIRKSRGQDFDPLISRKTMSDGKIPMLYVWIVSMNDQFWFYFEVPSREDGFEAELKTKKRLR